MTETQLLTIQDKVINILEKRFFSPQDVLYDYAGMNGEVILPTPEECDRSMPNGLSWHTPVSNGAFFNGKPLIIENFSDKINVLKIVKQDIPCICRKKWFFRRPP